MKLVTTVPTCSWEQKYTFTPRIHHYRGVKGVVRQRWWKTVKKPTDTSAKKEENPVVAPPKEEEKIKTDKENREPLTAKVPSVPRKPRSQRPQSALLKTRPLPSAAKNLAESRKDTEELKEANQKEETTTGGAPNATIPAKPVKPVCRVESAPAQVSPTPPPAPPAAASASAKPEPKPEADSNRTRAMPAARARRFQTNYRPLPPSTKGEATSAVKAPTKPKESYKPRIKLGYALPPSFETDRRQLEAMLEDPTLLVERAYPPATVPFTAISSGAQHHFPPSRQALLLDPQYKRKTRAEFLEHLAGEDPYVVTAELREKLNGPDPSTGPAYCYDYNFNSPDLVDDAWEQRLLAYYRFEDTLYDRVVGGVLPLTEALAKAQESLRQGPSCAAAPPTNAGDRWVAVRDDGHVCSPIELHPVLPAVAGGTRTDGYYYYDTIQAGAQDGRDEETEYAVLVRPFVDEVAANSAARWEREKKRVVAKGREWDRQYAIRAAVGPTAQEALLDLRVDPRYRRPGEHLLRRNIGVDQ